MVEVPGDPNSVPHVMHKVSRTTPPEHRFITDDARFFAELIGREWSLGDEEPPNIAYVPEAMGMSARVGAIYVYIVSRSIDGIESVDYRTVKRTCRIGFKISNRFRDHNFEWTEEVVRILLKWRRAGQAKLNGWSYYEVASDNQTQGQGWYTTNVEIKLTKYNQGIMSAGFGDIPVEPPKRPFKVGSDDAPVEGNGFPDPVSVAEQEALEERRTETTDCVRDEGGHLP